MNTSKIDALVTTTVRSDRILFVLSGHVQTTGVCASVAVKKLVYHAAAFNGYENLVSHLPSLSANLPSPFSPSFALTQHVVRQFDTVCVLAPAASDPHRRFSLRPSKSAPSRQLRLDRAPNPRSSRTTSIHCREGPVSAHSCACPSMAHLTRWPPQLCRPADHSFLLAAILGKLDTSILWQDYVQTRGFSRLHKVLLQIDDEYSAEE